MHVKCSVGSGNVVHGIASKKCSVNVIADEVVGNEGCNNRLGVSLFLSFAVQVNLVPCSGWMSLCVICPGALVVSIVQNCTAVHCDLKTFNCFNAFVLSFLLFSSSSVIVLPILNSFHRCLLGLVQGCQRLSRNGS